MLLFSWKDLAWLLYLTRSLKCVASVIDVVKIIVILCFATCQMCSLSSNDGRPMDMNQQAIRISTKD